jgi:hypothetical protein
VGVIVVGVAGVVTDASERNISAQKLIEKKVNYQTPSS